MAHHSKTVARRALALAVALGALGGCASSHGTPHDAAVTHACPATLPSDGAPCTGAGLCGYVACEDFGVARARCDGATFTVSFAECGEVPCRSAGPCSVGGICVHSVGGALFSHCMQAPEGPLTCDTICGGECSGITGEADPPLVFECNTCTSGICP